MAQHQSPDWQSSRENHSPLHHTGRRIILRMRDLGVVRETAEQPSQSLPLQVPPMPSETIAKSPSQPMVSWLEDPEMEAPRVSPAAEASPPHFTLPEEPEGPEEPEIGGLDRLSLLPEGYPPLQDSPLAEALPPAVTAPSTCQADAAGATVPVERMPAAIDPALIDQDRDERNQRRLAILRGTWMNRAYITGISATILIATYAILNGLGGSGADTTSSLDDSLFTFEDDVPSTRLNEAPAWSPTLEKEKVASSDQKYIPRFEDEEDDIPQLAERVPREDAANPARSYQSDLMPTIVGELDRSEGARDRRTAVSRTPAIEDGYEPSFAPPGETATGGGSTYEPQDLGDDPPWGRGGQADRRTATPNHTAGREQRSPSQDSYDHWAYEEPSASRDVPGRAEAAAPESTRSWDMPETGDPYSSANGEPRPRQTRQGYSWDTLDEPEQYPQQDYTPSFGPGPSMARDTVHNPYVDQSLKNPAMATGGQPAGSAYPPSDHFQPYPQVPKQANLRGNIETPEPEIRR